MPDDGGLTVLVLAPVGRDAETAAALLGRGGVAARVCASFEELCNEIENGAGVVVVAEEALHADMSRLTSILERQPAWSDLPFVMLTRPALDVRHSASKPGPSGALGNVMLLERPFNGATLLSAVRTALRSRHRQYQVRDHLRERQHAEWRLKLVMNELNHRVKNTLATVQSIAMQTLRGEDARSREAFEDRLIALSKTHNVLAEDNWEGASLRALLLQELIPYSSEQRDRFILECAEVRLKPNVALALAMAFHELATNAAKYGALSSTAGRIHVECEVLNGSEPPRLRLRWQESGGPPVEKPRRRGFGSRLIERGLAHELHGDVRIDYAAAGVVCSMEIPLAGGGRDDFA